MPGTASAARFRLVELQQRVVRGCEKKSWRAEVVSMPSIDKDGAASLGFSPSSHVRVDLQYAGAEAIRRQRAEKCNTTERLRDDMHIDVLASIPLAPSPMWLTCR